ncbi:hypothetical protein ACIRH0_12665 [Streptomyces sp. NPDC093675]|uniref:hypothetical protein n=1 Tax=Streptomyces sp. NPDC093675 TaxID=3366049 RepID=UPI0037FE0AE6
MPGLQVLLHDAPSDGEMWVPGPQTVRVLLDASDATSRRCASSRRCSGIADDREAVLEGAAARQDARALERFGCLAAVCTGRSWLN